MVTLGDLRGSVSDADISVSSQPASRASSLDISCMDQQQLAQARAPAAQTASMVLTPQHELLFIAFCKLIKSACQMSLTHPSPFFLHVACAQHLIPFFDSLP